MKKIFALVIIVLLFSSCKQKTKCNLDPKVLKSNDSILSKIKTEGGFKLILSKIKEPEIETLKRESYRFLIISAFGDYQSYRVSRNKDNYEIIFKDYHKYFVDPITHKETVINSLTKERTIKINENDWTEIKENLNKLNFWQLAVNTNESYLDGTVCIIEAYNLEKNYCTERNYHATSRFYPEESSLYTSLFEKMIKLTKE